MPVRHFPLRTKSTEFPHGDISGASAFLHSIPSAAQGEPSHLKGSPFLHDFDSLERKLLDCLYDGVYFVDPDRRITYWNRGAERLTGYTAKEALGRQCFENFLMHVDDAGSPLCLKGCPLSLTVSDGQHREAQVYLRHKQGHRVPVCVRVSPIKDERGSITGAVEIFSDSTAIRNLEKRACELESLAYSDALTGVANRRYIDLKVQQAIQEVDLFNRSYGLILIDIDHFKAINDTCGHAGGDEVLRAICETLLHCLRSNDVLGRWGGDEFVILARDVTPDSLEQLAHRCSELIARTSIAAGREQVSVTVSVGSILLEKGESSEGAFSRADRLLYVNKCVRRSRMR
jgi:diguanylate cyclase (GGDEF)-like protein/PAS domain S-box-containing protein